MLEMSLEELLNVEITTAGKTEEKVSDIPASVVIITRADIERYGYMSLEEILENVPGLYAIDDMSDAGTAFGVRGFWTGYPRNIIFMVNGVSQANGFNSAYTIEDFNIPIEAIDRVEVVRGPMSVIYGSGAFFGAINIITNQVSGEEAVSIISASAGSQDTRKIAVRVAGHEGDLNYVFTGGYYDTYGPNEPLSRMVSDTSILEDFGITKDNNTTGGRLENSNKYFNLSGTYKGFYTNMSFNQNASEFYFLHPTFSDGNLNSNNLANISSGYKKELSDMVSINGNLDYQKSISWSDYNFFWEDYYGSAHMKSEGYEAELNAYINPSDRLDITTGLCYQRITDNQFINDQASAEIFLKNVLPNDIDTRALFAQANYNLLKNLRFVAGLRLEQMQEYSIEYVINPGRENAFKVEGIYEQEDIEVIPRFAAIYALNDQNILKFLYGTAMNRPSFYQNSEQARAGGNNLEPEYIQTFELNYIATPSPGFTLNASVFHNELWKLIVGKLSSKVVDDSGTYILYYTNAGQMVTNGAELTVQARPFLNFLAEFSGTWQKTRDRRARLVGIGAEYSPDLLGYVKASYCFNRWVTLALTGNYVDEMETHWDVAKPNPDGSFGGRVGKKVDSYFTLGANLRITNLFGKGYYLNIKGSNLLDKDYLYPMYTNNHGWADKGTIGHGRTLLVSAGRKF